MSSVTLRQWWSTVAVTARQPEPLTYLTLVANVQTGIEDYVQTLTPWPLTFKTASRTQTERSEVKWGTGEEMIWPQWMRTVEAHKWVCLHSKRSADDKHFCSPCSLHVCVCCELMLTCVLNKIKEGVLRLPIWSLLCSFCQFEIN